MIRRSLGPFLVALALLLSAGCAVGSEEELSTFMTYGSGGSGPTTFGDTSDSLDDEAGSEDSGSGSGEGDGDGDTTTSTSTSTDTGGDVCGDGVVGDTEACDGANLVGESCQTLGFDGGILACAPDCSDFDTTGCTSATCGNNIIEGSEVCDGTALDGASCTSLGYTGGTLACNPSCSAYDTTGCTSEMCGNNVIEGSEVCDGNNLNGQTCVSQGYNGGTLSCNANCLSFNTAGCTLGDGDCCTDNLYAGCQVAAIEACVCALDSYCCTDFWDSICVDEAVLYCGAIC